MIYAAFTDYTIISGGSVQSTKISGVSYTYRAQINAYINAANSYTTCQEISTENRNVHEWASNEISSSDGGDIDQQRSGGGYSGDFGPFWYDTKTNTGDSSTAYNCRSVIAF